MPSENESASNSQWVQTWKENASAFDRVKSVTMTLTEPRSAPWIADEAAVSPNTARDHLRRLVELGVVNAIDEDRTRRYSPDPLYTRLRDIRDVLDGATKQQLSERAVELKTEVETWRERYDVDSPDGLRERAATDDVSADEASELIQIASDWELTAYRLSIVQDALENYETWTSDRSSTTA